MTASTTSIVSEGLQSVAHNPFLNPPASAGGSLVSMLRQYLCNLYEHFVGFVFQF